MPEAPKPPVPPGQGPPAPGGEGAGAPKDDDIESLLAAIGMSQEKPAPPGEGAGGSPPKSPAGGKPSPGGVTLDGIDSILKEIETKDGGLPVPPAGGKGSGLPSGIQAASFETFSTDVGEKPTGGIDMLMDVQLNVKVELGRSEMLVQDVLKLTSGSVVELDKLAGDPLNIYVNERLVARGEVLVLNDTFCVRITEILSPVPKKPPAK